MIADFVFRTAGFPDRARQEAGFGRALRRPFHRQARESDHTRNPAPARTYLTAWGDTLVAPKTGKRGVNCSQRGFLMRAVWPSFYGVQAMVLRRDPLLAHIQLPMSCEHAVCQTSLGQRYFVFLASTNSFRRTRICIRRLILALRCRP
jgi:hypothetical protein